MGEKPNEKNLEKDPSRKVPNEITAESEEIQAELEQASPAQKYHHGVPMDVLYAQVPKGEFLSNYIPQQYPYILSKRAFDMVKKALL